MKMMKKLLAFILVLCMVVSICACGGNSDENDGVQNNNVESNQTDNDETEDANVEEEKEDESEAETAATFKVKVVDEGGNPVANAMVQLCKEACVPAKTDETGVATFNIEITDGYKLSVMSCPTGYEYTGEAEIYLEAGATEHTITMKAVQ